MPDGTLVRVTFKGKPAAVTYRLDPKYPRARGYRIIDSRGRTLGVYQDKADALEHMKHLRRQAKAGRSSRR